MKVKAFENVKNQIGFCGIWCGSCVVGNGTLKELTKRYEEVIKDYDLESWAPKDFNFKELRKGLTSIQAMLLCQGCRKGGGRLNCEMRICASDKNLSDCTECDKLEECENSETLEHMISGAQRAGLLVKTENANQQELLKKWTVELESKWPSCIILCASPEGRP